MSYLSKKEYKRVSRLIAKKLTAMGVKDEITLSDTGVKRLVYDKDEQGQLIIENGKLKHSLVASLMATNIFRRTLRQIRKQDPAIINNFLGLEVKEVKPAESNLITT